MPLPLSAASDVLGVASFHALDRIGCRLWLSGGDVACYRRDSSGWICVVEGDPKPLEEFYRPGSREMSVFNPLFT